MTTVNGVSAPISPVSVKSTTQQSPESSIAGSLNLVSLALASSLNMFSASVVSEAQINTLIGQIEEALKSFKEEQNKFVAPNNVLTEMQAASQHAQNALAAIKAGGRYTDDAKMRIGWTSARLKRAKERMVIKGNQ